MSKKNHKDKVTGREHVAEGKPEVTAAEEHGYPPINERHVEETTVLQEPSPEVGRFPFTDEETAQEVAAIPEAMRRNRPDHTDHNTGLHVDPARVREEDKPAGQPVEGVEDTNLDFIKPVTEGQALARTGTPIGITALGLSVLSLFIFPFVMSTAGIIGGFFAHQQGARTLGWWAMGIGAVALLGSLFFAPYFR